MTGSRVGSTENGSAVFLRELGLTFAKMAIGTASAFAADEFSSMVPSLP
jgi:hypothetical protein